MYLSFYNRNLLSVLSTNGTYLWIHLLLYFILLWPQLQKLLLPTDNLHENVRMGHPFSSCGIPLNVARLPPVGHQWFGIDVNTTFYMAKLYACSSSPYLSNMVGMVMRFLFLWSSLRRESFCLLSVTGSSGSICPICSKYVRSTWWSCNHTGWTI